VDGGTTATYAYDATGLRVAKVAAGITTAYLHDLSGAIIAEQAGQGWGPGYVYLNGELVAQYGNSTTYFAHHDQIGSTRLVTNVNGTVYTSMDYLPFGEQLGTNSGTTHKFTGKERDSESNLDNFGVRYLSSSLARWSSPDRLNLTQDRLVNPSNTLNKYLYSANNPLRFIDPDGRDIVALFEPPNPVSGSAGHFMLFANNPSTGESAIMSFGEVDDSVSGRLLTATGAAMASTKTFELPQTVDDLRAQYAVLTIQTSPEQAQDVINYIKSFSPSDHNFHLFSQNCTTVCRDTLKAVGLIPNDNSQITPSGFWGTVFNLYSKNTFTNRFLKSVELVPQYRGIDYGNPRFGIDTFDFIISQAHADWFDGKTNTLHGYDHP
jgi:RHS repeat-associated protein